MARERAARSSSRHGAAVWRELQGDGWLGMLRFDASLWFPALVIPWLGWRSLGLLASARDARPSPLDQVFDSAASARRFVGHWGRSWPFSGRHCRLWP